LLQTQADKVVLLVKMGGTRRTRSRSLSAPRAAPTFLLLFVGDFAGRHSARHLCGARHATV